jgi:hypothetical protein
MRQREKLFPRRIVILSEASLSLRDGNAESKDPASVCTTSTAGRHSHDAPLTTPAAKPRQNKARGVSRWVLGRKNASSLGT